MGLLGGGLPLVARPSLARPGTGSPPTPPFQVPLPLPPEARKVDPFRLENGPARWAGRGMLDPQPDPRATWPSGPRPTSPFDYYRLVIEQAQVSAHPALPPTTVWRYRDLNEAPTSPQMLGPTFRVRMGDRLAIRYLNTLPANHVGFGHPETSVHLHGGHHEARSDGYPDSIPGLPATFGPGHLYDYRYDMRDPGWTTGQGEPGERPSTLWYHDHKLDFTGQNVVRGLAGFFLVHDELDTGKETTGLQLPSDQYDLPLALLDRTFDDNGQIVYDSFNHVGYMGDRFLVNGAVQPFHGVKRRKYRLRILNASNSRYYALHLVDEQGNTYPFDRIGVDSSLMAAPQRDLEQVVLAPAERAEIVVDFSQFAEGAKVYLEDRVDQVDGRGPNGTPENPSLLPSGPRLLRFDVQNAVPDPSQVPSVLRPFTPISPAEIAAAPVQNFEFRRQQGTWVINGQYMDPMNPITTVPRGEGQVWRFSNPNSLWWHPVHLHHEFMRVLSRNGGPPMAHEADGTAKKDTVQLGPLETLEVFVRFRDYKGPFVFHCHNLEHEDMFMMARFDVV